MSQEAVVVVIQNIDNLKFCRSKQHSKQNQSQQNIRSCLPFLSSGDLITCKINPIVGRLSVEPSFPCFTGVTGSASDFLEAQKYLLGVKLCLKLTRGVCIEWAWYWPPAGCSVYPAYLQWGHLVCASALLPRAALDAWVHCTILGIWHMVEMSGQGSISAQEESLGR